MQRRHEMTAMGLASPATWGVLGCFVDTRSAGNQAGAADVADAGTPRQARYGLRERIEARWGERLHTMNLGLQRDGVLYLLSLRVLPVIPFVAVNLLSGLTRVPSATFFWVSILGMLPATVLYVNAGVQLAQADSIQGLLSVQMLGALTLLGVLPLAALRLRKRRA